MPFAEAQRSSITMPAQMQRQPSSPRRKRPRKPEPAAEAPAEVGKTLVVYFSASGSTKAVAETIADELDADVFELVPTQPYSSDDLNWTVSGSRVNREHDDETLRDIALVSDSVEN